ncbi:FRG domain-containing protein [Fulvivirga ligni]|uniref:FRG domain-containing protein n=1 Tax=Fulvivirga ligni TaxID=2904246 RepID=UPI00351F5B04
MNTLQREKLSKSISFDFPIDEYVNNFRNKGLIKKYFDTININLSKISVLSFMQHYGAPTPLVDFTRNIEIGIFFAIENLIGSEFQKSENIIDDYFSVFHINNENCKLIDIESN